MEVGLPYNTLKFTQVISTSFKVDSNTVIRLISISITFMTFINRTRGKITNKF